MKFYLISKFPPHVEVAVHFANEREAETVIKILKYIVYPILRATSHYDSHFASWFA